MTDFDSFLLLWIRCHLTGVCDAKILSRVLTLTHTNLTIIVWCHGRVTVTEGSYVGIWRECRWMKHDRKWQVLVPQSYHLRYVSSIYPCIVIIRLSFITNMINLSQVKAPAIYLGIWRECRWMKHDLKWQLSTLVVNNFIFHCHQSSSYADSTRKCFFPSVISSFLVIDQVLVSLLNHKHHQSRPSEAPAIDVIIFPVDERWPQVTL